MNSSSPRRGWLAVVAVIALPAILGALLSSLQWVNRPFPGFFIYGNLTVAPFFLPEWSANKKGLKVLDRLVAIEGQALTRPETLYDSARASPPGTDFRYTVERAGNAADLAIPSMKFTFLDWLLSFGTYILAGLGFLVIGFTPFYMRAASPAAPVLFFMVSAVFVWFTSTSDIVTANYLPKEVRFFALTLTASAGIHLALALTRSAEALRRARGYLYLVYAISIALGLFSSFTFHGAPEAWNRAVRLSYGYGFLAALVFLGILGVALRNPASDLERSRLRVILSGALFGFFLPTLGTVLASFLSWNVPYNLSLIPTVFFPLSVAYALLKYSLFELDFIVKAGLTRGALAGALLLLYVLLVSSLGVGAGIYGQEPLVPIFFSVLVVLIFNPLLRSIEGAVDHYVYRKEYDPAQIQTVASEMLRSLSRPQAVAEKFVDLIGDRMKAVPVSLCFSAENSQTGIVAAPDLDDNLARDLFGRLHVLWSRHFGLSKKALSRAESSAEPLYEERRSELAGIFDGLRAELIVAIIFHEQIAGFVSVGRKRSGKSYDADDLTLLCTLADQLALALENGRLFEESERAKESYRCLYDESQTLNQRLIEADRLKKQFVSNISHELRTPVCTILGYAEVLRDPAFAGDPHVILERVANHGQELSRLMDDLMQFTRMESGSLGVALREINVGDIFQGLEAMARRMIKERPIRFSIDIERSVSSVITDGEKFQQVLTHFLTNALKFTEKGEIAVGIRPAVEQGEPFIECWVADTGIGIGKKDQEAIFEDFRQLDGSSTRHYGGTGVGLGLCKKLAQSLGGKVAVQSEVGKGSVFSLIIPDRRSQTRVIQAA